MRAMNDHHTELRLADPRRNEQIRPSPNLTTLDADAEYIEAVVPIMDGAATAADAKAAIKVKSAKYGSDFLLGFSVDNYFSGCKKAP